MRDDSRQLVSGWIAAGGGDGVRAELEAVYAAAAGEIAARGPACWASGRCCNFEKTGHLLYVTGLEAAYTVWKLREDRRVRDGEEQTVVSSLHSLPVVMRGRATPAAGACPFQEGNLCTVHAIKPLGCRVYFCDRSAQEWQHELSERLLAEIRAIHERHGIEYRYGEWRGMLGQFEAFTKA